MSGREDILVIQSGLENTVYLSRLVTEELLRFF